ncbi:hypothetical protein JTB14_028489 [Gonioctena quinquepunctata]|nr:hypothetical protein JTB14_028489 [Gonioctena quinquepunctata]
MDHPSCPHEHVRGGKTTTGKDYSSLSGEVKNVRKKNHWFFSEQRGYPISMGKVGSFMEKGEFFPTKLGMCAPMKVEKWSFVEVERCAVMKVRSAPS